MSVVFWHLQAKQLGVGHVAQAASALVQGRKAATEAALDTAATCGKHSALEAARGDAAALGLTTQLAVAEVAVAQRRDTALRAAQHAAAVGTAAELRESMEVSAVCPSDSHSPREILTKSLARSAERP